MDSPAEAGRRGVGSAQVLETPRRERRQQITADKKLGKGHQGITLATTVPYYTVPETPYCTVPSIHRACCPKIGTIGR